MSENETLQNESREQYWQNYCFNLVKGENGFRGNPTNAGALMALLERGAANTITEYREKIGEGFKLKSTDQSKIVVDDSGGRVKSMAAFVSPGSGNGMIVVDSKFLEKVSAGGVNEDFTQTNPKTRVVEVMGTVGEVFELGGAEEAHHIIFGLYKGKGNQNRPQGLAMAKFVSSPVEQRALSWRIRYAKKHQMSEAMINSLEHLLIKAKEVRANSKSK